MADAGLRGNTLQPAFPHRLSREDDRSRIPEVQDLAGEDEKVLLRRLVILLGLDPPLVADVLQRVIEGRPAAGKFQVKVENITALYRRTPGTRSRPRIVGGKFIIAIVPSLEGLELT